MRSDSSNLDVLRSLAVFFVILSHLPSTSLLDQSHYHIQALGLLGVLIFFVHTCLVLMLSLERQSTAYGERRLALTFFVRRAFRIYPLSIVIVLLLTAISLVYPDVQPESNFLTIVSNLLLIQNVTGHPSIPGALWSLPFEVQMYLVLPALYILVERLGKNAPRRLGLLWLGSAILVLLVLRLGLNYHLIKFLPCFLPGVLAFALRSSSRKISSAWLFFYVIAVAVFYPWAVAHGMKENILAWPVCLCLGMIIPMCGEIESSWVKMVGKILARYSYGIYLVHGPCIELAFNHFSGTPIFFQWMIFIGCTAGLSYIAYHAIEKPGIEFGLKLAKRINRIAHEIQPVVMGQRP